MDTLSRKSIFIVLISSLCLLISAKASAQGWSNGYTYRRAVTIDHTKVPNTDQSNFPFLFSSTYSDLATTSNGGAVTNSNGYDIIFTSDAAGTSVLPFERESYNATTGAVIFWIQIPALSHTSDPTIYLFYGNSSVTTDQSNNNGVWDSNYKGVWHLSNGSTLSGSDSTSDVYTLTNNNSTAATSGQIDGAASFNGSSNYLSNSSLSLSAGSSITVSFWNYQTSSNLGSASSFTIGNSENPNRITADVPWSDSVLYWDYGSWNGGGRISTSYSSYLGAWTYVVLEYNATNTLHSIYLNGALAASTANSSAPQATQTGIDLGVWPLYSTYAHANIDEFRVSSVARSADWNAAEYNNQSSPATFYTTGGANAPFISSLSPTSGNVGSSVTITGTAFGSSQGSSTVTFAGTSAIPTSWSSTQIIVAVPTGSSSGNVVVTVASQPSNHVHFAVTGGYTFSRAVTIDHTKVPNTDQTNFPMLFSGTYAYLATTNNGGGVTNSNGYDIVFASDAAGASILPFERESYNATTGAVSYWVQIPTVSHTSDTVFYLFYGNSSVTTDQSNKNGTWDSNYKGVWHLPNGTTLSANDSTNNGYNGTVSGPTATTGQIDGGASYSGGSNNITITTSGSLTAPFTIEEWAAPASLGYYFGLFGSRSPSDASFDAKLTGSGVHADIGNGTSWLNTGANASFSYSANTWHHFVYVVTTSGYTIYADGSQIGSGSLSGTALLFDSNHTLEIGATGYGGESFNGSIDEARVSTIARSADWIATEYNNQSSPQTYYNEGSPVITSISPTSGTIGTAVTINGSNFGGQQGSGKVYFNGLQATSISSWSNSQIVALVPSSATTGAVTVIAGGSRSNANLIFTVYNPVISSLSPNSAPSGGSVTIAGSGFGATQGGSTIQFNAVTASVSSWSDTSITVTVPSNAASGPVTVTVGGVTSNGVQFTALGYLSITSLSSSTGPVGGSVMINGSGFGTTQGNAIVAFNSVPTTVTSWSNTQIVAIVPGAGPGPVTVQIASITAIGPTFTPIVKTLVTDSLGNSSTYVATVVGGKWRVSNAQGSGCSSCTIRGAQNYGYDTFGNITSLTDANGNTATYGYDSDSRLLSETHPVDPTHSATTSYTYNGFGEPVTITDALGNVTTNAYDSHGNLTSVTTPAPNGNTAASATQFAYNSLGELTTITDPLNHVTTLTYTTAGLVATITDAQNHVTTYGYDTHGNRTSVKDANNQTTTFAYDAGDRLTTITYPGNATTTFGYDTRGRRTSVTDQNGKTTSYAYDDADRLTSVTNAASQTTAYAYDTENNLTTLTDANTHSTFFTPDAFGRVTKANFPSSQSETYAYDANNNLTSKTDRKGQTITYTYDDLNRLTSKTYPDTTSVTYTYDLVGKVLQVTDPSGTYAISYDNMGRPTGTTTTYTFLTGRNFTTSYSYDAASNRTAFTDPEGGTTGYTYDTLNRLATLAPPAAFGSGSFGFSYDVLSRRTQMTRPNNVTTNYTYDNLSRLLSVLHQVGSSTIDGASYGLDNAGNRTSKTDWPANVTSNYTYDAIYELTQVTQGTNTTESYSYDSVHNRLTSLGVASYTTNNSNELTSTSSANYTYDNNGNMLTKTDSTGTTTYAWDFENRLTSVTLPGSGGTVTFKYDPLGRRIYKSSSLGTTIFSYNGSRLVETVDSSGSVVARYTEGVGIDEPLAELQSGTISYYEADGLGSITSLTSAAGAIANTYTYDSFGKQTASSGSVANLFRNTGREFDTETNLSYNRARYFDASTGRFLNEDPISFRGGINFYAYTRNNPANYADPLGLCPANNGTPCVQPNLIQQYLSIPVLGFLSKLTGWTLGNGIGAAGAVKVGPGSAGVGAAASQQLVVSPNGQAAIITSTMIPAAASGSGGVAGIQMSISNAQSPSALSGPFNQVGGGYGDTGGVAGDYQWSNGTWQLNGTVGFGMGGFGVAGGQSVTNVDFICQN